MEKIAIESTSSRSAICTDIVIRNGDQVRLAFRPEIVDNPRNPNACVRGRFVYQRKGKKDAWVDFDNMPLSSLKKGEGFQLQLRAGELLPLLQNLGALYRLHRKSGVPHGRIELVKIEQQLAKLLQLSEAELNEFLEANSEGAVTTLRRVLSWLSRQAATTESLPEQLPDLNALLGLANLRAVSCLWQHNRENDNEEFWQKTFAAHSFVLSQLLAYPVVLIKDKAYVGGKRIDNAHGSIVDFLGKVASSGAPVLIEIKTPQTPLLGREYRQDVYPPSRDVTGAVSQVLLYRESLMQQFHALLAGEQTGIIACDPKCVVVVGNAESELLDESLRRSFERYRQGLAGVTVLTFDEVFARVEALIHLLQQR
jgi:hypothetical protein